MRKSLLFFEGFVISVILYCMKFAMESSNSCLNIQGKQIFKSHKGHKLIKAKSWLTVILPNLRIKCCHFNKKHKTKVIFN